MSVPRYQWQPTTAEIAAAAGISDADVIRFDHNTSPFPTPWAGAEAASIASGLNEYPGASYLPLRRAAAAATGVDPEYVVPGAGADELILLAARAFLGPSSAAAAITPTYSLYRIATAQVGAALTEVPRRSDLAFPADALIDAARDADLTWLCVPDNPVGDRVDDATIAAVIAATDGLVVLDAAYAEFCGDRWSTWVERYHNLLVVHTMSKAHGLAGIRVGYAIGHPDLVDAIDGVRPPGSISTLSAALAITALGRPEEAAQAVDAIAAGRVELAKRLGQLGFEVLPSTTNFLLCRVGPDATRIGDTLMKEGLVVRTYPDDGPLAGYLRFTVRDDTAHDRLLDSLRSAI